MDGLTELLDTNGFLVLDGAMGTELFTAGLMAGDPPEIWNMEHPDRIRAIHQSYVDAGSDIILTNSFGGNRHRLKLHSLEGRVHELNAAAASIGRDVVDAADRRVLVAGSMGPTGELITPLGELTTDEARVAFAEQAAGLADIAPESDHCVASVDDVGRLGRQMLRAAGPQTHQIDDSLVFSFRHIPFLIPSRKP